jgi:SAM-dependent methyltransferase
LKAASQEERSLIFSTMYDQLFAAVPDHPRLTRRASPEETASFNAGKYAALRRWLKRTDVVVEFAPGDCEFALELAHHASRVIGVDISDQRQRDRNWPGNFELVVYDGYRLPTVPSGSIDVIFSDQLLEHLHPNDVHSHLCLCFDLLKPGGRYVLRTPHAGSGPWDVSRYFCDEPQGFHLKEWTYREIRTALQHAGFDQVRVAWNARRICLPVPFVYVVAVEWLSSILPKSMCRRILRPLIPTLHCVAIKGPRR